MRLPPAPVCPECRSAEADWKEISGRGEVFTYTLVHRPIAADQELPFVIAVIALEDAGGVRMISNLVGVSPDELEIGMAVELVWEDMSSDLAIPRFRPRAGELARIRLRLRSTTFGAARVAAGRLRVARGPGRSATRTTS